MQGGILMNTEDVRKRAERALIKVEEDIEKAEKELADKSAFHLRAWQEYGSELCAGGMLKEERLIQERIAALGRDRSLLCGCLADRLEPVQPPAEHRRLAELDKAIAELAAEHRQIAERQIERDRLADLLCLPRGVVADQAEETDGQRLLPLR
jgi:hypothetical protein